jgi:cell division protease FtsH
MTTGPPATNNDEQGSEQQQKQPQPQELQPWWRYSMWLILLMTLTFYWASVFQQDQGRTTLSYSDFKAEVSTNNVEEVTFEGDRISGRLRRPVGPADTPGAEPSLQFESTLPPMEDADLMPLLEEHEVDVLAQSETAPWWAQALIGFLPFLLIIGLLWYGSYVMQRRMMGSGGAGGLFGFGKSRARLVEQGETELSFKDVAGLDNAKRDLWEIVDYLREPEHYRKLGAKIPKGILLMGPPGTGKTLLARAMAGEADVPFFSISGSEFVEMFVGVGAARVRDMFDAARKRAPSIIFIDEIDSVGRARGTGLGGGHDEREQTLNQILGEMDGFDPHEAVVVLAATNRPDVLDSALLRPGRFDRKITLDLPDKKARRAILDIHVRAVPLAEDVDLDRIAGLTPGFAGADLENLINEAALLCGRENRDEVNMESLLNARDKVVLGGKREMIINEEEKNWIAHHEAGHAVAASLLPNADPLDKVTIIPRGRALGATEQIPEEERHNLRESYLRDRIGVLLGGRAAELMVFGESGSGAEDDLKQATLLARHMVTQWGMSDEIGPVAFRRGEEHIFLGREMTQQRDFSDHTAEMIDDEIRELVKSIEQEVEKLLEKYRPQLEALAKALLEKETLEAAEIQAIIGQKAH